MTAYHSYNHRCKGGSMGRSGLSYEPSHHTSSQRAPTSQRNRHEPSQTSCVPNALSFPPSSNLPSKSSRNACTTHAPASTGNRNVCSRYFDTIAPTPTFCVCGCCCPSCTSFTFAPGNKFKRIG